MQHKQGLHEFSYSINKGENNEPANDPFDQEIKKTGIEAHFTLRAVKDNLEFNKKQLKNLETQKMAHDAQIILLTNRHPEYNDIHEADYATCMAFCSKKLQNKEIEEEIENAKEIIKSTEEEINHICKVLDIHVVDPKELETKPEEISNAGE